MKYRESLRKLPFIRKLLQAAENNTLLQHEAIALNHLANLRIDEFIPWTGSSISPASIRIMLNEIVMSNRTSLIEFGAGISTLYFASILKQRGEGRLVSVEQDSEWLRIVQGMLDKEGLTEYVELVHCPLATDGNINWYNEELLNAKLDGIKFDFILIDAPISDDKNTKVREPAGEFIQDRLAKDFTLFLDDTNRLGEQEICDLWQQSFNWVRHDYWPKATVSAFRRPGLKSYNIC